jgi:hypothetical protein
LDLQALPRSLPIQFPEQTPQIYKPYGITCYPNKRLEMAKTHKAFDEPLVAGHRIALSTQLSGVLARLAPRSRTLQYSAIELVTKAESRVEFRAVYGSSVATSA